jgi:D-sedoheptulose 7-phosphate isomerase
MRDWAESLDDHFALMMKVSGMLRAYFDPAVTLIAHALVHEHKVLICGNGGSACDAAHLAAELVVRFVNDRRPWPAIALTDPAILTAAGNDYGYQYVFKRQVEAYGLPGDVLIAISTSGKSRNVLEAIATAKARGLGTLGLSGSNPLGCDVDIAVPSLTTARIQEMHILCGHLIVEELERRLPP